jgi:hypothetical protein
MLMAVCALTFLVMALSSTKSANGGVRTILVMFEAEVCIRTETMLDRMGRYEIYVPMLYGIKRP